MSADQAPALPPVPAARLQELRELIESVRPFAQASWYATPALAADDEIDKSRPVLAGIPFDTHERLARAFAAADSLLSELLAHREASERGKLAVAVAENTGEFHVDYSAFASPMWQRWCRAVQAWRSHEQARGMDGEGARNA